MEKYENHTLDFHRQVSSVLLKNDKGTIFGKVSFELAFAGYEEEAKSREGIFIGDYENKRLQEGGEVSILWNFTHPALKDEHGEQLRNVGISLWVRRGAWSGATGVSDSS